MAITQVRMLAIIRSAREAEDTYNALRAALQRMMKESPIEDWPLLLPALLSSTEFPKGRDPLIVIEEAHFRRFARSNTRAADAMRRRRQANEANGANGEPIRRRRPSGPAGDTVANNRLDWAAEDDNTVRDEDLEKFNNSSDELL